MDSMERDRERSGKSCSSFKFGSFVFLAAVDYSSKRDHSLVMLSPVSGAISSDSESPWPWNIQDGLVDHIGQSKDQLIKVELDKGGEGSSINEDKQQQQQQLVLKLNSFGVPPKYELTRKYKFGKVVCACNGGLVCLYDEYQNEVSLWNPSTKEHRILPEPKEFGEDWNDHFVLFGFDVETKDYKVVLLTGFKAMHYRPVSPIECLCRVQIYSLSTDCWRLLEGIIALPGDIFPFDQEDVLYLNGSCFFQAFFFHTKEQPCFPDSDRFVISFDFTKEIFTPMQLPDHHRDQELYLVSLGDKIALFTKSKSYHKAGTCEEFNIWLLKGRRSSSNNNNVNKESWKKLHFFQVKHESLGETILPIGLSDDGQWALLQTWGSTEFGKKVKLYHLLSKEVKESFISCSLVLSKAHAFKPSLVSIMGGNGGSSR